MEPNVMMVTCPPTIPVIPIIVTVWLMVVFTAAILPDLLVQLVYFLAPVETTVPFLAIPLAKNKE
jgi:hypothetical protein